MSHARKLLEQLLNEKEQASRSDIAESEQALKELRENINNAPVGAASAFMEDFDKRTTNRPAILYEDTNLRTDLTGVNLVQALSEYGDHLLELERSFSEYETIARGDMQKFSHVDKSKAQFWGYIAQIWRNQRAVVGNQRVYIDRLIDSAGEGSSRWES